MRKTIKIDDTAIKFQMWDTAGQEKFRSLTSMYYRNAETIVVCYDITKDNSFEDVKYWIQEIRSKGQPDV